MNLAFTETDGGIERGEATETDRDGRYGRARPEGPVLLLKDGNEIGGHRVQFTAGSEQWIGQKFPIACDADVRLLRTCLV